MLRATPTAARSWITPDPELAHARCQGSGLGECPSNHRPSGRVLLPRLAPRPCTRTMLMSRVRRAVTCLNPLCSWGCVAVTSTARGYTSPPTLARESSRWTTRRKSPAPRSAPLRELSLVPSRSGLDSLATIAHPPTHTCLPTSPTPPHTHAHCPTPLAPVSQTHCRT